MIWPPLPQHLMLLVLAAAVLWGVAAALLPLLGPQRQVPMLWILVGTGVPVLGALTYVLGPGIGLAALISGLLILVLAPLALVRNRSGGRGSGIAE